MGNVCDRWLGCCCFGGETKEASLQFVPSKRRNCTDVLFLLLYIASWVGLIAIIIVAAKRGGDPEKIYHGVDYLGNTCGRSTNTTDRPYAAWVVMPQLTTDQGNCTDCYEIMTCVSDCSQTAPGPNLDPHVLDPYYSDRLMYYCIPSTQNIPGGVSSAVLSFSYSSQFNSAGELASRAMIDLYIVWPVILISAFVALVFSFGYTALSKHYAGLLILVTIILLTVGGFLMSYALLKMAADADGTSVNDRAEAMRGLGIGIAVVTALFLLIIVALRQRIYIAVEVVKESSRAVLDMWGLIVFPIIPFVIGCGYFVLFIATTLYLASVWSNTPTTFPAYIANHSGSGILGMTYQQRSWDQGLRNAFAYVFLHLLWTIEFLVYFTFMVVAGAVANWYFTPRNAQQEKVRGDQEGQLSNTPVVHSTLRTIRFHLGTIALASLIIAVIQFIRAVVTYIEEQVTPKHGPPNQVQKAVFCLVQCCLKCVQCCMDKINKNALVWCAIYGDSFAESACSSFALIWSNLARVAALSMVSAFLMFLGKMLVAFLTTGVMAIATYKVYNTDLNSLVLPVVVIFLLSYLVAALFMGLVDTTSTTVFLCFLVDEKFNKASGHMLASEGLQSVINAHNEHGQAYAEREHQKTAIRQAGLGATATAQPTTAPVVMGSQQISAVPVAGYQPNPLVGVSPQGIQLMTAPSKMI